MILSSMSAAISFIPTVSAVNETNGSAGNNEVNGIEVWRNTHNLVGNVTVPPGAKLIINAGAYTHTSIAIHDALKSSNSPAIEVHISNIHKREEFRHKSYLSSVVDGIIVGFGDYGYELAIHALIKIIKSRT